MMGLQFEKKKLHFSDWLLIIGFVMAPMDSLRFVGKIGIAELSIFLWCIISIVRRPVVLKSIFTRFWFFFLLSILLGSAVGAYLAPSESTFKSNFPIYLFFSFLSIVFYSGFAFRGKSELFSVIRRICIISGMLYYALLVMSKYAGVELPGARMWFYTKFTGGADNPNKLSVYISAVIFLNVYCMYVERQEKRKPLSVYKYVPCILASYYVGTQTQSSMFYVSVYGSIVLVCYLFFLTKIRGMRKRVVFSLSLVLIIAAVGTAFFNKIFDIAYNWISQDSNGLGRFHIFASIKYTLEKSVVFGLGPGIHALNGTWSYHNAFLEILAMSGVVGLTLFLFFLWNMFARCRNNYFLFTVLTPLIIYSMGSFAIRNIEFWFLCVVVYLFSEFDTGQNLNVSDWSN